MFGLVLLVIAVAFYVSGRPKPDLSLQRVQDAGVLIVGLDPSYPPFEVVNGQGQLDGYDVELANELARRLGVKARLVSIDFGGIVDALTVGKLDVILGGVSPDAEYLDRIAYSQPYYDDGQVLVLSREATGNTIGVESGSDADLALDQLRPQLTAYQFAQYDDQDRIRAALGRQEVRGAIVDAVTAAAWAGQIPGVVVEPRRLTSVPYTVAARRGDRKLLAAVDEALRATIGDGINGRLGQKWLK
jgi:polar amino acid transport system substrate-binding protein